jgi:hypothetical protein
MSGRSGQAWALLGAAVACAAAVAAMPGPPRVAAGAVLCLFLPGRLAVLALVGPRVEPALRLTLTIALSLAATMLVGFAAAVARRVDPTVVAFGLLGVCALLAAGVSRRRAADSTMDEDPLTEDASPAARPARWLAVAAAVPLVALSAVLAVRVVDAARYRSPDAYFTELSVESGGPGRPAAVVRSRERDTTTFSYEERRDGSVVQTARVTLRPGERTTIDVLSPLPGRVELVLYRAGHAGAYRRVIP